MTASPLRGSQVGQSGMQRGTAMPPGSGSTGPGGFGREMGQARTTTPIGGRGASPRMETRPGGNSSDLPGSNSNLDSRPPNGGGGVPPSPWDMTPSGSAGYALPQRGGECSPGAGGAGDRREQPS